MPDRPLKFSFHSASDEDGIAYKIAAALRAHRWFVMCALVSLLAFAGILTNGSGALITEEQFADFYDHQAESLLHGRLDVPREVISLETFEYDGKAYGYFGPTPALLRLPFVALHLGFGQLSRCFMLLYFGAALVAGYLILLEATRRFSPERDGAPSPWIVALFAANAGIGNTMFFLASRAYIYHEAILCGAMFALWSVWCSLRYLDATARRWWIGALTCGVLSLHARPPTGLFALTVLGVAASRVALRLRSKHTPANDGLKRMRWRPIGVVASAVLGVASFNGLSYLKFHTFEGCPLRLNIQYDDARLARIDGRQFHFGNLSFSTAVYLLQRNASVSRYFPYVEMTALDSEKFPRAKFPRAKIDLAEPTLGFPYAMPGIFVATLLGAVTVFALGRAAAAREPLAVIWLGAVPMGFAMFAAVAVSHRYTADFCPFFVAAGAFGCASIEQFAPKVRSVCLILLGALTAAALFLSLALTLRQQGEVAWGVSDATRANYARLREGADRFFGVRNPRGYDHLTLPVRQTDASTLSCTAKILIEDPTKYPRAIALYEQIVVLQPQEPFTHTMLAQALVRTGRVEEGIEQYRIALKLDPTFAAVHHNLGVVLLNLGRKGEAIQEFVLALRHEPNLAEPRIVLENLGVMKKATP